MEEAITRRELLLRGIVVASGLVLSSLLAACAEIPETREVAEATATATSEVMPTHTHTAAPEPSPTATKEPTATPTSEPATSAPEPATATPEPVTPTPAEMTPSPEEPIVYVTLQRITSYSSPGEEHGYIIPGKKFTILDKENGWLRIRLEEGAEPWIQASETAYRPASAGECEFERCECYQEIALYWNAADEESFSKLVPGTNKTFIVADRQDGRMLIKVTEPSGAKWEAWADDNPGAYGPVGAAPPPPTPTPEKPPAAVCTEPYFINRSVGPGGERKTGVVHFATGDEVMIRPGGNPIPPHFRWFRRLHGDAWVAKREGTIIAIDNDTQIITFDLGGDLVVKRKFTLNTQVMMYVTNRTYAMPQSEAIPIGGNLCDLEVGDAAAILHPSEGEGANPSLEGDLWGVFIVQ